jgi:hypothetical protein
MKYLVTTEASQFGYRPTIINTETGKVSYQDVGCESEEEALRIAQAVFSGQRSGFKY